MVIDPVDLQELLEKEPFRAFRIRMSDGKHYDVTNPAVAVPMETMLFLALSGDRWKMLSYINMASVEDLPRRARSRRDERR